MKLGQNLVNTLLVAASLLTMTYLLLPIRQKAVYYNICVREAMKPILKDNNLDSEGLYYQIGVQSTICNG